MLASAFTWNLRSHEDVRPRFSARIGHGGLARPHATSIGYNAHVKHRLFTILSALSLVLGLILLLLWPRSNWREDQWYVISPEHQFYGYSNRGAITFQVCAHHSGDYTFAWNVDPAGEDLFASIAPNAPAVGGTSISVLGIGYMWCPIIGPEPGYTRFRLLRLPYPWLIAIAALAPIWWLRIFRKRRHRQQLHLCPACGYDLRASKERCPECGTPIPNNTESCSTPRLP